MLLLKLIFASLSVISVFCGIKNLFDKQKNPGFIILCWMIAFFDILYIFIAGAHSPKEASNVLLLFYALFAWILPVFMVMVIYIDRIKKQMVYLIGPVIISLYQTYLVISQFFGARIFSFQKRIYFRKAFFVAVDTKNTGLLFSYRSYRVCFYINLVFLLIILITGAAKSLKMFRGRYNVFIIVILTMCVFLSISIRFTLPVWIAGVFYNIVSLLGLYYITGFPKNRLRAVSLDSFANDMSDGLILYDKFNELIHVNDMVKNTLGDELIESFRDRNKLEKWIEENAEEDNGSVITFKDKDEREYFFKVHIRSLGDEKSLAGTLYIIHDTTDSLSRIKAVEKTNEELERVSRMKSDFLANMSHEIRTPMNAVIGLTELAIREKDTPELTDYLLQIQNSGRNLLNIINDILDYSKIESGKMDIVEDEYEPFDELYDIANALYTRVEGKPVELFVVIKSDMPHKLKGDAMRIRQVLINLANNAIKFTKEGIVRIEVSTEHLSDDTVNMVYHVIDTGIGIKEEDIKKLFISFSQVDSRRNRLVEGTGLGLAISQRLVNAMNGDIGVTSKYGEGSDFYFSVPQKIIDDSNDLLVEGADTKRAFIVYEDDDMAHIFIDEMERLGVNGHMLKDIDLYKGTGENDIFFFKEERYDDRARAFFEKNKNATGVVLVANSSDFEPDMDNIHIMRRPLTTMTMVRTLNGRYHKVRKIDEGKTYKAGFICPDAKILVVDDNEINLMISQGLISPLKAEVDTADGGIKAYEMIKDKAYDIVFMDHMMPDVDGVDATKMIRAEGDKIHQPVIIALSANVMEEAKALFEEAGMDGFVPKPVEVRILTEAIKKNLPEDKIIPYSGGDEVADEEGSEKNAEEAIKVEGLSTEKAAKALGSAALYNKVLKEYCRSGPDKLSLIAEDVENENWSDYTIKVHALKSSSRQIGALELGDLAEDLEKAGKAGDIDKIHALNPDAIKMYSDLIGKLEKAFPAEEENDINKPLITEEGLKEITDSLRSACEDLDLDKMEAAGDKLKVHSYDDAVKEDIKALIKAIADVDVDKCTEIIDRIGA